MPQDLLQAEGQRVFLADVPSLLVDHGQAIRVRILAETDIGLGRHDFPADAGQILGRGFGRMRKQTIRLPAEHGDAAAQFLEQALPQDAAGPVIRIQQHAEAAAANRARDRRWPAGASRWRCVVSSIACACPMR